MLVILLIILPLLVSCPIEDPFAALEGVNLLSTDEQAFTGWAVDYSSEVSFDYLTFNSSTAAGPATGDTVKRIELVNLVPNGDFEAAVSSEWDSDGTVVTYNAASNYLSYSFTNNERVYYNMNDAGKGLLDGLVDGAGYIIHFDVSSINPGTSYFEFSSPVQTWKISIEKADTVYYFPADFYGDVGYSFSASGSTQIFSIGNTTDGGAMTGYIDNLRISRTDIDSFLSISVPVSSDGREDLLSGIYRFTVYVKNDPDVTPTTANRMPAEYLTLSIESPDDASVSNISFQSFGEDWSDWTACSVTGQIQIDDGSESALVLQISPTDTVSSLYKRTLGSLLISSPILEYSSDGVFE